MNKRLTVVFRHIMYNLRGGFLIRPLAIALSLGLLGAVFSWVEEWFPTLSSSLPKIIFPSHADPLVAQVILSDIATSVMTVVSIVFAILLMTLTLASMQFSPRIIVSFSTDRVTQRTLGLFLGTFCYCMAALPAARTVPHAFAPVLTVAGAMLLALACVSGLLFFIHHISHAISVNYIVDRIAGETVAVVDKVMPHSRKLTQTEATSSMTDIIWDATVLATQTGYIRFVDVNRIFELARIYRVRAEVMRRVGQFVPSGIPLLRISSADRLPSDGVALFRGALDMGPARTLEQDVEFGVLQIVDIALKAISPAVNDPSTAIGCIDQLSGILIRFASRELPAAVVYDLPGQPRVIVRWITFDKLLHSAFDQIRHYGIGDVVVSLRLLRALNDIATTTADARYRSALLKCGENIVAGCSKVMAEQPLALLRGRLHSVELLTLANQVDTPV